MNKKNILYKNLVIMSKNNFYIFFITLPKKFFAKVSEEQDLEKRFFRYACFYTVILSVIALLVNLAAGLGFIMYLLSFISIVFFTVCFYYSKYPKLYKLVRNSFFIGFIILLDFFYFFNGGLDSSIT